MRHTTLAQWSNQQSIVHAVDARVKLVLLICFVVPLALVRFPTPFQLGICFFALIGTVLAARLPVVRIVRISLLSVPFVGVFAVIVYLTGDPQRAWAILAKSYLSALSVLVTTCSTPLPRLIAAAHYFHMPELLLEVTQVIYRYFFVISGQAHQMQTSFQARGGKPGMRALRASSGMIAVLFGRSYEKAVIVHQAMLGRGFTGRLPSPPFPRLQATEFVLVGAGLLFAVALHSI